MPEPQASRANTVVPTLLSAISALGVAYLAFVSTTARTESDSGLRDREISLEQTKFDASERQRYEETVVKIVAQILSQTEGERQVGRATLLTLYPDRAEDVLKTIASVTSAPEVKAALQAQARAVGTLTPDSWVIIAGGDRDLNEARVEVARANRAGLTASLYQRRGFFRTTIGPFPTRSDAERANIAVRGALRSDAYPVRLSAWCPAAKQNAEGYFECP